MKVKLVTALLLLALALLLSSCVGALPFLVQAKEDITSHESGVIQEEDSFWIEEPVRAMQAPSVESILDERLVTLSGGRFTQMAMDYVESLAPVDLPYSPVYSGPTDLEDGEFHMDISHINDGYVGILGKSNKEYRIKFTMGDKWHSRALIGNGNPQFFVMPFGDGQYEISINEVQELTETGYLCVAKQKETVNVKIEDETARFLMPNQEVNYKGDMRCIKAANAIAGRFNTDLGKARAICAYVAWFTKYDDEKANSEMRNYTSDPEKTFVEQEGICVDYATLTASMLRSVGIPAKVAVGSVNFSDVKHAWNEVYIDGRGWITVDTTTDLIGMSGFPAVPKAGYTAERWY